MQLPPPPSSSGIRQSTNSISCPGRFEVDCQGNRQLLQFCICIIPPLHSHMPVRGEGGGGNIQEGAASSFPLQLGAVLTIRMSSLLHPALSLRFVNFNSYLFLITTCKRALRSHWLQLIVLQNLPESCRCCICDERHLLWQQRRTNVENSCCKHRP